MTAPAAGAHAHGMMKTILVVALVFLGCGGGAGGPSGETGAAGDSGSGAAGTSPTTGGGGTSAAGGATGSSGSGAAGSTGASIDLSQQALSGSRLKAYWYTGPDGSKQFGLKWYDSLLKIDCYMTALLADGSRRCLPLPTGVTKAFADSSCTTQIIGLPKGTTSCGSPNPAAGEYYAAYDASSCQQVFQRGAAFDGTAYEGKPGACAPVSATVASLYAFFMPGPAVDPGIFAAIGFGHD